MERILLCCSVVCVSYYTVNSVTTLLPSLFCCWYAPEDSRYFNCLQQGRYVILVGGAFNYIVASGTS